MGGKQSEGDFSRFINAWNSKRGKLIWGDIFRGTEAASASVWVVVCRKRVFRPLCLPVICSQFGG